MEIPSALRLPLHFDPQSLRGELEGIPDEAWIPHFNTQYFEGEWSGVPLTAPKGAEHPILQLHPDPTATEFVETALLRRCPRLRALLARLECPRRSARLLKLGPGARILRHTDYDLGYEDGEVRLHLPIQTNAEISFRLDEVEIPMRAGELWYLNVNLPHEAHNAGADPRIHLVVDCAVDAWLEGVFRNALAARDGA
jgi:aspartyl/asparaginyl beta-hydroxylase (cupin superfamily)